MSEHPRVGSEFGLSDLHCRRLKLTLHSWELPSFPREQLRVATRAALVANLKRFWPETAIEIAFNAAPDGTVYDPENLRPTVRGAQLEVLVVGGLETERHRYRHVAAHVVEGILRRTLLMFIEQDAIRRRDNKQAGYRYRSDPDTVQKPARSRINV